MCVHVKDRIALSAQNVALTDPMIRLIPGNRKKNRNVQYVSMNITLTHYE